MNVSTLQECYIKCDNIHGQLYIFLFSVMANDWPHIKWLQTIHIYYLTVSVGQKVSTAQLGSLPQDLTRLQSRGQPELWLSHRFDWGKTHLPAPSVCWQNPFTCDSRTEGFTFSDGSSFSPRVHRAVFALWASPSWPLTSQKLSSSQPATEFLPSGRGFHLIVVSKTLYT